MRDIKKNRRNTRVLQNSKQPIIHLKENAPNLANLEENVPELRFTQGKLYFYVKHGNKLYNLSFNAQNQSSQGQPVITQSAQNNALNDNLYTSPFIYYSEEIDGEIYNIIKNNTIKRNDPIWIKPKEFDDNINEDISVFRLSAEQNSTNIGTKYFALNELHLNNISDSAWLDNNYFIYAHINENAGVNSESTPKFTVNDSGNLYTSGSLTVGGLSQAFSDTDKFLVSDSGTVKYRTGAQILSDLGISADEIIDWTTDQGSTNIHANNIVITHNQVTDFDTEITSAIDALIDSAPGALNTLNELAAALGDDANFSTTVTNSIATKVGLTGDETVAGHKKFSDDVLIAGTAADTGTNDEVSLGVNSAQLRVHTNYGYVQIGPSNENWSHFYTDRDRYYFNKPVTVDGEYIASYNQDLVLRRVYNDSSYNQITIGDDSFEIKLDNTSRFNIDGSGNIAVTGTVDGRNLATDGSKLDGIEAGATADQTTADIINLLNTDIGSNFTIGNQTDDMCTFTGPLKSTGTIFAYRQNYPQLALSDDNGADKMYIGVSNEHAYIEFMDDQGAGSVNSLRFRGDDLTGSGDYSDADVMTINFANNRVGINTTSPQSPFHVAEGDIRISTATDGTQALRFSEGSDTKATLQYKSNEKELNFTTEDASNSEVTRMTIKSEQDATQVGIGTDSPDANLQIHSTSGTKLWLTAAGSNPADAASLRFAESENGNNYIQLSYDGSANELSVDSNNNNDMTVWNRVNNRVTHGASTRFYRAWPQVRFSDDSGTDYVDGGLSGNTFLLKTSDHDINYQWQNNNADVLLSIDSQQKTVTIGEGNQDTYALKIGNGGRMNMPLKGLEFEHNHGYWNALGEFGLTHYLTATQNDLIRHRTPLTLERWNGSAYVDALSGTTSDNNPTNNLQGLKNILDGSRTTAWQIDDEWRKFRFVITRQQSWAEENLIYLDLGWSSTNFNSGSSASGSMCPTLTIEQLHLNEGETWDASDDSNNDWTTNATVTSDWHSTGIASQYGTFFIFNNSTHHSEVHVRITVEFPAWDASEGGNKRLNIRNVGMLSQSASARNTEVWTTNWDRDATGYGHVKIPDAHSYYINNVAVLGSTTLGSGVVNSSLTNLGTLTSLTSSGVVNINGTSGSRLNITNTGDTAMLTIESQGSGSSGRSNIKFNTNGGDWELGARNSNGSPDNSFYIYENGNTAYRLVIEEGGHVGIGTTNPAQKLDVAGSIQTNANLLFNSAGTHYLKHNGGTASSDNFTFRFSDNEDVLAIRGDGRVGINTTSPGAALDVVGTGWASKGIRIKSTTTSGAVLELETTARGFEIASRDNGFNIRDTDGDTSRFTISSGGNISFHGGAITSGEWQGTAIANSYVADLPTSKITSGTMADARIASSNVTQHQADIDHDSLNNFVANEHIDWTTDQGGTNIHSGNYTDTNTNQLTTFVVEDGDGTEVTVSHGKQLKFVEAGGININFSDTDSGADGDEFDLSFNVYTAQTGITSILNSSLVIGRDSGNQIDFGTDNQITFKADDETELELLFNTLRPAADGGLSLGNSSYTWANLYLNTGSTINWGAGNLIATHASGKLTFNGELEATKFDGPLEGNADTATEATNVTVSANNTTDETVYPVFVDGATGTQGCETDTGLNYNPSGGQLTATTFSGSIKVGGHTFDDIDIAGEFTDSDSHIMSSAAIQDQFPGTVTNVTGGEGIDVSSGTSTPSIVLDLAEVADGTGDINGAADEIIYLDVNTGAGTKTQKRKQVDEWKLSQFNDDISKPIDWTVSTGGYFTANDTTARTQSWQADDSWGNTVSITAGAGGIGQVVNYSDVYGGVWVCPADAKVTKCNMVVRALTYADDLRIKLWKVNTSNLQVQLLFTHDISVPNTSSIVVVDEDISSGNSIGAGNVLLATMEKQATSGSSRAYFTWTISGTFD